jgi:hypothetical protein
VDLATVERGVARPLLLLVERLGVAGLPGVSEAPVDAEHVVVADRGADGQGRPRGHGVVGGVAGTRGGAVGAQGIEHEVAAHDREVGGAAGRALEGLAKAERHGGVDVDVGEMGEAPPRGERGGGQGKVHAGGRRPVPAADGPAISGGDDEDLGRGHVRQHVFPHGVRGDHGGAIRDGHARDSGLARVPPSVRVRIREDDAGYGDAGGEERGQQDQGEALTARGEVGRP